MAFNRPDPNASLADYKEHLARKQPMGKTKPKEHLARKQTKIDKAIANAQAFQKQRTALINMSTKDKLVAALESSIIGAATGGGIIAAQKGIHAAVNSGIPARAINKVTGQEVVLHGRQTAGYSEIKPAGGKYENQPELAKYAYNYFDNPKAPNIAAPKGKSLGVEALPFAHEGGTLYAVKGPKESFTNPSGGKVNWAKDTVIKSQINQKVVGSIPINHAAFGNYESQIASMLKRAGVKIPKNK
jgi:hypothetical protein